MKVKKFFWFGTALLLLVLAVVVWWRYYFVFGEGVKAGNLNFLVKKGYLFKTWEGRLIQTGFKTPKPGSLQSNNLNSAWWMTVWRTDWKEPAANSSNCAIKNTCTHCPGGA